MGIKLDISMETPLSDDDRDILAGISVMVLAIANRQNLADQGQSNWLRKRRSSPTAAPSHPTPADRASRRSDTRVTTSTAPSSGRASI